MADINSEMPNPLSYSISDNILKIGPILYVPIMGPIESSPSLLYRYLSEAVSETY